MLWPTHLLLLSAHGAAAAIGKHIFMAADRSIHPRLELVVGNKAYSSWSLRAWLALRVAAGSGHFRETNVLLAGAGSDANRDDLWRHSPTGKVPSLKDHRLDITVWDSLAICEAIAEIYPEAQLWPADAAARAVARSVAAEMHSGFSALRSAMPMNTRLREPRAGYGAQVAADVARVCQVWWISSPGARDWPCSGSVSERWSV